MNDNLILLNESNDKKSFKNKIYFSFHPNDLEIVKKISQIFVKTSNCSIYFFENSHFDEKNIDNQFNLSSMNLLVMFISYDYLYDKTYNYFIDFKFAEEKNIPILPIFIENNLEQDFNNKYGNLQCLSAVSTDPTEVEFKVKLVNYLERVMLNIQKINEIRSSFDSFAFLSYRKKDRIYVNAMMKEIYNIKEFQNIGIWYDEFLTPGEDFNDNILDEIKNSSFFILAITPNILEKGNYVINIEIPKAIEEGKIILPISTENINEEELHNLFNQLPKTINIQNGCQLKDSLLEILNRLGIKKEKQTPIKNYLLGVAYLKGIFVEKNCDLGLEYLRISAEEGDLLSLNFLSELYENGDGVEKNIDLAIEWKNKYIEGLTVTYTKNHNTDNLLLLLNTYQQMLELYKKIEKIDECIRLVSIILNLSNAFSYESDLISSDDLTLKKYNLVCEVLEECIVLNCDFGVCGYYENQYLSVGMAINLLLKIRNKLIDVDSFENQEKNQILLAIDYLLCVQAATLRGDLSEEKIKIQNAIMVLPQFSLNVDNFRKILLCRLKIGEYYNENSDWDKSFFYNGETVNLAENFLSNNQFDGKELLLHSYLNLAEFYTLGNANERLLWSEKYYLKALPIIKQLLQLKNYSSTKLKYAEILIMYGRVLFRMENKEEGEKLIKEGFSIVERAFNENHFQFVGKILTRGYLYLGKCYSDNSIALPFFENGIAICEKLLDVKENLQLEEIYLELLESAKTIYDDEWSFDQVSEINIKINQVLQRVFEKSSSIKNLKRYYNSFNDAIEGYKCLSKIEKANELRIKSQELDIKYRVYIHQ